MKTIPFPTEAKEVFVNPSIPRFTQVHDVQALLWVIRQSAPESLIIEIGCNLGRTTQEIAKQFPTRHILAVDSTRDAGMCPEQLREGLPTRDTIGKFVRGYSRVNVCDKPSVEFLKAYLKTMTSESGVPPVGVIFVDGDHSYNAAREDTNLAIDILLASKKTGCISKGIIIWHDFYPNPPAWVGVERVVNETDKFHEVTAIENTWIAFAEI
jgi:hypothetical protein